MPNPSVDFPRGLGRFVHLGGKAAALIDAADQTLLFGRMPQAMRQSLANRVAARGDNRSRALTALDRTGLSGRHAVTT